MRSPGRTPFGRVTSSCLGRRRPDASRAVSVTRLVPPWANSSRGSSSSASRSAPWSLPPACSSRSHSQDDCPLENGPPRPPNRASKKSSWEWDLDRSEEHTSELQSQSNLVCRLLLEKKKKHYT